MKEIAKIAGRPFKLVAGRTEVTMELGAPNMSAKIHLWPASEVRNGELVNTETTVDVCKRLEGKCFLVVAYEVAEGETGSVLEQTATEIYDELATIAADENELLRVRLRALEMSDRLRAALGK